MTPDEQQDADRPRAAPPAPTPPAADATLLPTDQTRIGDPLETRVQTRPAPGSAAERTDWSGQTWGDVRIDALIGAGGMGAVYRGHQLSLDRPVAIKVLGGHLSSDESFRQRFLREARAVAQISSPHVVQIYSAGIFQQHHFFVMELVEGVDLARMLADGFRPSNAQAFDLVLQAARGLAAAGRLGIVHRDIKPGNMLLTRERVLKITDFGLAKILREDRQGAITGTGIIVGTASYFSPEQGLGEDCDCRTDLYALGVVAYELFTGRLPFTARDATSIIYQHVHERPVPVQTHNPTLHPELAAVVMRLLEKRPADRFATAEDLVARLEHLAIHERISRPTRRSLVHWVAAAALVVGAIILASVLGLGLGARRAAPPAEEAESLMPTHPVPVAMPAPPLATAVAPFPAAPPAAATAPVPPTTGTALAATPLPVPALAGGRTPPPPREERLDHAAVQAELETPGLVAAPGVGTHATLPTPPHLDLPDEPMRYGPSQPTPAERLEAHPVLLPAAPSVLAAAGPGAAAPAPPVAEDGDPEPDAATAAPPAAPTAPRPPPAVAAPLAAVATTAPAPTDAASAGPPHRDRWGAYAEVTVLGQTVRLRWCPPGSFLMGSPAGEPHRHEDEELHQVVLTHGFYLADSECTQALYLAITGEDPSHDPDMERPVDEVSWLDAQRCCARLQELVPGFAARLPTEAEWEYAARAGGAHVLPTPLQASAWTQATADHHAHAVRLLAPNAWGFYDLLGNVGEWCADSYHPYEVPLAVDPPARLGGAPVIRGGSYHDGEAACRIAARAHARASSRSPWVGFRIAATTVPTAATVP